MRDRRSWDNRSLVLHIHRADRADRLADALAAMCAQPLADPFAAEVVAVPTRGIERWLTQRLSTVLGTVAAAGRTASAPNVEFPFPDRLITRRRRRGLGHRPGGRSVAGGARRCGRLLEVVDECLDEPWLAHAGAPPRRSAAATRRSRRRAGSASSATSPTCSTGTRCTGPDMLRAWADGRDLDATGDRSPTAPRGRPSCGAGCGPGSAIPRPAERLAPACERLADDLALVELPDRFSLFGLTRLPAGHLAGPRRAGSAARRAPVPPAPIAGALGQGRGRGAGRPGPDPPRATTRPRRCRPTGCSRPGVGTSRELQLVLGAESSAVDDERRPVAPAGRPDAAGAGSRRTSRADREPPGAAAARRARRPAAARPRRPHRSRSTPATAAPARSR